MKQDEAEEFSCTSVIRGWPHEASRSVKAAIKVRFGEVWSVRHARTIAKLWITGPDGMIPAEHNATLAALLGMESVPLAGVTVGQTEWEGFVWVLLHGPLHDAHVLEWQAAREREAEQRFREANRWLVLVLRDSGEWVVRSGRYATEQDAEHAARSLSRLEIVARVEQEAAR